MFRIIAQGKVHEVDIIVDAMVKMHTSSEDKSLRSSQQNEHKEEESEWEEVDETEMNFFPDVYVTPEELERSKLLCEIDTNFMTITSLSTRLAEMTVSNNALKEEIAMFAEQLAEKSVKHQRSAISSRVLSKA